MAPELDCVSPTQLMEGYLRKPKKWSKRYFVLREGPPPSLEYYDNQRRKSSGKPKKVIQLENAWNIDKKATTKHKYLVGIYTEKEYFCMAADNETMQNNWVNALRQAVLNNRGVSTSSHIMYNHIWHGHVDARELGDCEHATRDNLHGVRRCCLTDKTMVFVQVDSYGGCNVEAQNHVEITIASIRACGHEENVFFMEPGRSSGIGTGKLSIELEDSVMADHMHKTILAMWNRTWKTDDSRQRSSSFGSTNGRQGINRSRQYFCPPPRQVGLGKTSVHKQWVQSENGSKYGANSQRTRCESFPEKSKTTSLKEESRYRASSEGEKTMKRFNLQCLLSRTGSTSPQSKSRVGVSKTKAMYPGSASHSRASSFRGSIPSSSSSSIEHINTTNHDCSNSLHGEMQSSADDYVETSPGTSFQLHEYIPSPPKFVPTKPNKTTPGNERQVQSSHSRCHSHDGNVLSTSTQSSLSTSPYVGNFVSASTSPSQDENYLTGSSPSKGSNARSSNPMPSSDYAFMSTYAASTAEYTMMTPGRVTPSLSSVEDKSGYVPMYPLTRSQPQEILHGRKLCDNKFVNGSYSPSSPNRSPDKHSHLRRPYTCGNCGKALSHSCPNHCNASPSSATAVKASMLHSNSYHGLKETIIASEVICDFNQNGQQSKSSSCEFFGYCNEYAEMADFPRDTNETSSSRSTEIYHEYLPMSPMNSSSLVTNVLCVAQSGNKKSNSTLSHSQRYPHQRGTSNIVQANSIDRRAKQRRRNTVSAGIPSPWPRSSRGSKHVRRGSTRVTNLDINSLSSASESTDNPPLSPGGEYVSISFDKAKKQMGPNYVTLEPDAGITEPLKESNQRNKITHDSNRNILPNVDSTRKDENQYPKQEI